MKNQGSSLVPSLLVLTMFLGLVLGCKNLDRQNKTVSDTEVKAENERKAKAEKCGLEKQALTELDAKVDDFAHLPSRSQLAAQPYLKGKLFIVEIRDKRNYVYDFSGTGCRMSEDCRKDAGCTGSSYDKFSDVRARSIAEVVTTAVIECRKIKHGEFVQTGLNSGEKIPGYDVSCNLTLVDRSIPAVVFKKTFTSELLMVEDQTSVSLSGTKELVARTPTSEMDDFLLKLPRRR
ncbi:MAG TPA: hypothetical protein VFI24_16255 [Pyrinomonadaceae bacterium]|nr:hypothetical protein [Pyrinomonadaceae bacterium]